MHAPSMRETLDVLADPARQHRPQDRQTLRCVAVELRQRGFTDYDISRALDLTEQAVKSLLEAAA